MILSGITYVVRFPSIFALDNNENLELSKVGRRLKSNGAQI